MISAYEWGIQHGSCSEALEARRALGPDATQANWWRVCDRGDWLLWQWERLPAEIRERTRPVIDRALERIVARAIRRGQRSLRGARAPWATEWRCWARMWLSGEDRTVESARVALAAARTTDIAAGNAEYAARAVASAARVAKSVWAAKPRLQARDIRHELPEWPGEEEKH